ncbi:MAG: hypothetical protein AAFS02_06045 [Pseudomonadota bacterium]
MANKVRPLNFIQVRKGSRLLVTVDHQLGSKYRLSATAYLDSVQKDSWSHSELKDKTIRYALTKVGNYTLPVYMTATGDDNNEVEVTANIEKPDGTKRPRSKSATLTAKKKKDAAMVLILVQVIA